jgi:hypothetical protein
VKDVHGVRKDRQTHATQAARGPWFCGDAFFVIQGTKSSAISCITDYGRFPLVREVVR